VKALLASGPRYVAIAAICVVLNNLLLIGLDAIGVHYVLTVITSAILLIPLSYWLHVRFTYRLEGGQHSFWRYAGVQIVNTPVALLLFFLIHDLGGVPMALAAPLITVLMFLYNFGGSFWAIVFGHTPRAERS
jgi:putative flippase GtrA